MSPLSSAASSPAPVLQLWEKHNPRALINDGWSLLSLSSPLLCCKQSPAPRARTGTSCGAAGLQDWLQDSSVWAQMFSPAPWVQDPGSSSSITVIWCSWGGISCHSLVPPCLLPQALLTGAHHILWLTPHPRVNLRKEARMKRKKRVTERKKEEKYEEKL